MLVAEYISDGERADETVLELLEKSFLPGIFPRALDGSNPFQRTPAEAGSPALRENTSTSSATMKAE